MCRYVAYFRVSTERQGRSGLGLAAQEAAAKAFIAACGATAKMLGAPYVEIESGKRNDRPELAKALEHVRLTGATLLIAKFDRLSRNAHFLLGLQEAGVKFVAADMPDANNLTVGIMALVAQQEREATSRRTKEALAAVKPRIAETGQRKHPEIKRLGNPNGAANIAGRYQSRAVEAVKRNADERAAGLAATIELLRSEGVTSANGLAAELNRREIATPRGGRWTARSVLNVTARL